jgi:hypothetical protein
MDDAVIQFRASGELAAAIAKAARSELMTKSTWMRRLADSATKGSAA